MKKIFVYLALACLLGFAFTQIAYSNFRSSKIAKPAIADSTFKPFALMELYTSEGCNNCPPAYKVVKTFLDYGKQTNQNIFLLDFHIDYFNTPWVDPFSSAHNTARQDSYGKVFPGGSYTPQMIVNGSQSLLGSNPKKVDAAVTKALSIKPSAKIDINSASLGKDGSVEVKFKAQNIPSDSLINIALVQNTVVQKVPTGENAGKTLTHHNVVRYMLTVPVKTGIAKIYVPPKTSDYIPTYSIIAFRQDLGSMKILAASEREVK